VPNVSGINPPAGNFGGGTAISIYGSGFSVGSPTVIVGGRPANSVRVLSDNLMTADVPKKRASTKCMTGPGFAPGSLCQSEIEVVNANGSSTAAPILPVLSGPVTYNAFGVVERTLATEVAPSASEYDYAPIPVVSAIRPDAASSRRYAVVRIIGKGFSLNTLDWVNFGPPNRLNSQQIKILAISDDSIKIRVPAARHLSGKPLPGGVSVQSSVGISKPKEFIYAGPLSVSSVTLSSGPTIGGSYVTVHGTNLVDVNSVHLVDEVNPAISMTISGAGIRRVRNTTFELRIPPGIVGPFLVEPCNFNGCASSSAPLSTYTYLSATAPVITHVTIETAVGSAASMVVVVGKGLSGADAVWVGSRQVTTFIATGDVPVGDATECLVTVPKTDVSVGMSVRVKTPTGISAPVYINK
jgi:hypothetical protein